MSKVYVIGTCDTKEAELRCEWRLGRERARVGVHELGLAETMRRILIQLCSDAHAKVRSKAVGVLGAKGIAMENLGTGGPVVLRPELDLPFVAMAFAVVPSMKPQKPPVITAAS